MRDEDYSFIPQIEEVVKKNEGFEFIKIKDSGHVCNIDQPDLFNKLSIDYIKKVEQKKSVPQAG